MVVYGAAVILGIPYKYNKVLRATLHVVSVIPVVVSEVLLTIGVVQTLFSVILSPSDMVSLQVVGDE
ncbi:MAG TPA: hypothetical protein DCL18_03800 [Prevotella sp.]|nr:hypothetical protein [Prevotella sp.]